MSWEWRCDISLFVGASESYDTDAWEAYNLKKENAKLRKLVQYICNENYGDDWFVEETAALGIESHY